MSGQPYKYESDPAKFRTAYMDQLNLRAKLDDENYQVNKVYKATGNLSARSVPDTRSTSEILADTEKLKISLIATMKPIANPQMASVVVQGVNGSKLNADGSFLIWFYQNADEIVKQLTKKYKAGIKGDSNDAVVMISHLEDMYSKIKDLSGSVTSYYTNPSTSVLTEGDIDKLIKLYNIVAIKIISRATGANTTPALQRIKLITKATIGIMNKISSLISTAKYAEIQKMIKTIVSGQTTLQYSLATQLTDGVYDISKRYQALIESLPSAAKLNTLILQFDKSITNSNDTLTEQIVKNILEQFPSEQSLDELKNLIDSVFGIYGNLPANYIAPFGTAPVVASGAGGQIERIGIATGETLYDILSAGQILNFGNLYDVGTPMNLLSNGSVDIARAYRTANAAQNITIRSIRDAQTKCFSEVEALDNSSIDPQGNHTMTQFDTISLCKRIMSDELHARGATGSGLRRGRPKGSGIAFKDKIDHDKGIKPSKHYIPFGRYFVNHHKLHDDVLAIKSMSGTNVREFPSSRISKKLSKVIRTIVGGGNPSFNDMNELTDEEKDYLFKVSKRAQISDKLSIPTPSKDAQDKDMNSFEVMKGEIMSGNDSTELIKKFKILLLKLSKSGVLPKREVGEIMQELIELGY